jgi:ketosteroid isomerase-like protein
MRTLIAAGLLLLAGSLYLVAQDRSRMSDEEGRILALETAWNRAEQTKDVTALDQLLAPSLVYVDYDGGMQTKDQFLASAKSEELQPEQIVNDQMTAHVYGDCAVVNGVYREKGVYKGKPYLRHGRFTDTWVRTSGTWQCIASQSTLIAH